MGKDRCHDCQVAASCVFYRLPLKASRQFQAIARHQSHLPGAIVFRQGEEAHGLFHVCSGSLRLERVTAAGRSVMNGSIVAPAILGLTEVTVGSRFQFTAEVAVGATLAYVARRDFVALLLGHSQVAVELLIWLSEEFERLRQGIGGIAVRLPLAVRLLHKLRELAELDGRSTPDGVELSPPVSIQSLADSLGCSRQWASKLVGDLERQGLLRHDGRQIVVTPAGMRRGSEDTLEPVAG